MTKEQIKDHVWSIHLLIEKKKNILLNLSRGDLGKVLYYFYASEYFENDNLLNKANKLLNGILLKINTSQASEMMNGTLSSGLAGLGYVLEILTRQEFLDSSLEFYQLKIDKFVYEATCAMLRYSNTDFFHGGIGSLNYLIYRHSRNKNLHFEIKNLEDILIEAALSSSNYVFFYNSFAGIKLQPQESKLGLAHGMSSILITLIKTHKITKSEKSLEIIKKGLDFILHTYKERKSTSEHFCFPNNAFFEKDENVVYANDYNTGLRWCYGDLNIVHLLYLSYELIKDVSLKNLADSVGEVLTMRMNIRNTRCEGSLFCHGSSGISAYFNYLHSITKNSIYIQPSAYWMNKTFKYQMKETDNKPLVKISGFLVEGFVGSNLVIIADQIKNLDEWKNIFLIK